jgi:hypothetical protein
MNDKGRPEEAIVRRVFKYPMLKQPKQRASGKSRIGRTGKQQEGLTLPFRRWFKALYNKVTLILGFALGMPLWKPQVHTSSFWLHWLWSRSWYDLSYLLNQLRTFWKIIWNNPQVKLAQPTIHVYYSKLKRTYIYRTYKKIQTSEPEQKNCAFITIHWIKVMGRPRRVCRISILFPSALSFASLILTTIVGMACVTRFTPLNGIYFLKVNAP